MEEFRNPTPPPPLVYNCKFEKTGSYLLKNKFKPLYCDEETEQFLRECQDASQLKTAAANVLSLVWSITDTNGLLGRGQMHVISSAQARVLVGTHFGGSYLDVGAGDGNVTARLAPFFDSVTTTEVSAPMIQRLKNRGFAAYNVIFF